MISFAVPGEPMSKERPRCGKGRARTPDRTKAAEERIAWAYNQAPGRRKFEKPATLRVQIHFYQSNRTGKDVDNMGKLVLDALNKHAWDDDVQVEMLLLRKHYRPGVPPETTIHIEEITNE